MDHNTHGRLIVIDGLDGSGKSTQFDRLLGILSPKLSVKGISFPDYDMPSATLVKMYLRGDFPRTLRTLMLMPLLLSTLPTDMPATSFAGRKII